MLNSCSVLLSVPHLWLCGVQTVELSDCEKTQALALRVLLSLCKFNQHRIHEMDCYHGYSMIHQVLIKPKCIVGYHVLKVSRTLDSLSSSVHAASAVVVALRWFLPELVLVILLLLDPIAMSVIELCVGSVLKLMLSHLMKHLDPADLHSTSDCLSPSRLP